ncbi:MAG: polysaccharide pyruvyl transferase family protein [Candidatus Staskawiczbacteria bacterium]|jgi:hypothetical protein
MTNNKKTHITYLGGVWPTNIGNAFIDLGSMYLLKKACPEAAVHFSSEFPQWFFYSNRKKCCNALSLAGLIKSDYLVVSGMLLCDEFVKLYEPIVAELMKNDVKFIINGGGGLYYSEKETKNVRDFLKRNRPYAFISRDDFAFKNYSDLAEQSYDGIDCGFFLSDYFNPAPLNISDFILMNFDETNSRKFIEKIKSAISLKNSFVRIPEINDKNIIRTHHSCLISRKHGPIDFGVPGEYFGSKNTLISDIPEDYLNLYANAKSVYSDRVHTCVAALSFGKPAMLFSKTSRAYLFDKVGAPTIKEKLTYPDKEKMAEEKRGHLEFLSSVFR